MGKLIKVDFKAHRRQRTIAKFKQKNLDKFREFRPGWEFWMKVLVAMLILIASLVFL